MLYFKLFSNSYDSYNNVKYLATNNKNDRII